MNKIISLKSNLLNLINDTENNIQISKTLNSVIFKKKDMLYCFNDTCHKKLIISCDELVCNETFHLLINKNIITFIDENLNTKQFLISFNILKMYVKNEYIILTDNKSCMLINKNDIWFLNDYEIIELQQHTLFFNNSNNNHNYIVNDKGIIEQKQPSNYKLHAFYDILKNVGSFDNFINLLVY